MFDEKPLYIILIGLCMCIYCINEKVALWFWKLSQMKYIKFYDISLPSLELDY